MSLATTAGPLRRTTGKRSWGGWWRSVRLPFILMGCVVFLAAAISYGTSTRVSGVEINCNDWQLRRFSFRRDPFTNYQWTGVRHAAPSFGTLWTENVSQTAANIDAAIAVHLRQQASQPRWDVVSLSDDPSQGPGAILVELLTTTDRDTNPFWLAWTTSHPQKAKLFWPAAQDLTRCEMYADLPGLFELAMLDLPADEFATELRQRMAASLANCSQQASTAARQQLAADLATSYTGQLPASPDSSARQDR